MNKSATMLSAFTILSLQLLSGCAAMFHGTNENIEVRSDEKGAKIYINDELVGVGAGSKSVPKDMLSRSSIRVSKPGCTDAVKSIDTRFDAATLLGVFVDFGIITIIGIDWLATGATQRAERTNYTLSPAC